MPTRLSRLGGAILLLALLLAITRAAATSNAVPTSGAGLSLQPIGVGDFVPPECEGLGLSLIAVLPAYGAWMTNASHVLIVGTDYNDIFYSYGSTNCVVAGGGSDTLYTYDAGGTTVLMGGAGDDRLYGSVGPDRMYGGDGDDRLEGDDGDDALYGEQGNDRLFGRRGTDLCDGGVGVDVAVQCESLLAIP